MADLQIPTVFAADHHLMAATAATKTDEQPQAEPTHLMATPVRHLETVQMLSLLCCCHLQNGAAGKATVVLMLSQCDALVVPDGWMSQTRICPFPVASLRPPLAVSRYRRHVVQSDVVAGVVKKVTHCCSRCCCCCGRCSWYTTDSAVPPSRSCTSRRKDSVCPVDTAEWSDDLPHNRQKTCQRGSTCRLPHTDLKVCYTC